ncbi:MAG: threonine/serine exporter family protein [Ruminococcus sp.]
MDIREFSLTVPSIVIMVPGLYLYRAIYNFGIMSLTEAVLWFAAAIMIIVSLPLGLIFARILTDRTFRYCSATDYAWVYVQRQCQ